MSDNKVYIRIEGEVVELTEERAWELCLQQWHDIVKLGNRKYAWLQDKHITANRTYDPFTKAYSCISCGCFFCEYAKYHKTIGQDCHAKCPGALLDNATSKDEDLWCQRDGKHWCFNPAEFYENLLKLNKKRKDKKSCQNDTI